MFCTVVLYPKRYVHLNLELKQLLMISTGYAGSVGLSGGVRKVGSREWRNVEQLGTKAYPLGFRLWGSKHGAERGN